LLLAFDPEATLAMLPEFVQNPIDYLLVKVAARCNIDCSYCYWFRDKSVYTKPKLMSSAVRAQLLRRVEEQIVRYSLMDFILLLHGGEPMLWGIENFCHLAEDCRSISDRTGCSFDLSATTNGVLLDDAWLDCFEQNNIRVTLSIDGPAHIHDLHRHTFQGGPTHALVERAIRLLKDRGIPFGVLAVCNPAYHPKEFVQYFASMGIDSFDILLPDATFDDNPPSVGQFYRDLFDLWLDGNREKRTLDIRSVENMVAGLLGGQSKSEELGYAPQEICTIMTDGGMEPLDVLRIAGDGSTRTSFNIFENAIEEIKCEPRWKAARDASLNLCEKCKQCRYMQACGGGYLPHRSSKENGYNNPSVYCEDLYQTLTYIQSVLEKQVYVSEPSGKKIGIGEALASAQRTHLESKGAA
jgi:uncharacterized protein